MQNLVTQIQPVLLQLENTIDQFGADFSVQNVVNQTVECVSRRLSLPKLRERAVDARQTPGENRLVADRLHEGVKIGRRSSRLRGQNCMPIHNLAICGPSGVGKSWHYWIEKRKKSALTT